MAAHLGRVEGARVGVTQLRIEAVRNLDRKSESDAPSDQNPRADAWVGEQRNERKANGMEGNSHRSTMRNHRVLVAMQPRPVPVQRRVQANDLPRRKRRVID